MVLSRTYFNFNLLFIPLPFSDAWVITGGTDTGVTCQIGNAVVSERSTRLRSEPINIVGIAPWGVVTNRKYLIGDKKEVRTNLPNLNARHTCFILSDDGTVGKYRTLLFSLPTC